MLRNSLMAGLAAIALAATALAEPPAANPAAGNQAAGLPDFILKAAGNMPFTMDSGGPSLPKFEDVTKDMTSTKGLFTLWSYPPEARDKDSEKLLCQIPASFLGEKFMLSTSFSGGGFFTGFPLDERVVQWELLDRQLVLVQPETGFVADRNQPVSDVVRRTYPDRIRAAVPIVTKSPSGDPVIDLGALLKSDFADIGWMSAVTNPFGFAMASINSGLSKWTKKKSFELNVEIGVELAINRSSPPGSYDKKIVHYSFWKLPTSDYQPRIADDRVGYFLTANQDWARPTDARDLFNRYIDRWHLVKRDPSLALCEPKQPIIFYIEKTVPVRFRRAVRDGISEWNKAYEKVGFINAVEVRQQTDDNEWKDLDPEDMRYSFFRWIVTGAGFAMGPHRANPFTGQIYDADIIFDDSMVRFYEQEAGLMLPSTIAALKGRDPVLADFFKRFPQWKRPTSGDFEGFSFGDSTDERLLEAMRERMRQRGHCGCEYAEGMKHQLALGHAMLVGQPREVQDRFLYDVVKEVVMHEVGHTLGLRHNFKASAIWTLEEIQERRAKGMATVGSVMDYNPTLFFKDKPLEGNFVTPTVGPYDYWAIEYGYRPADGSFAAKDDKPKAEDKADDKKAKDAPKAVARVDAQPASFNQADIPKEVLDKLPPEVRKMIASGAIAKMGGGPAGPGMPPKPPSGPMFAGPNAAETEMLTKIASRAGEPELAYASDEDTTMLSPDPRSNRFDMGRDPIEWADARVELINSRMGDILEWSVKDQESWYHLRQAFVRLMMEKAFVLDYVGRYIGGLHTSRSHRGDPEGSPPFAVIDPKVQRSALEFIEKHLFSDNYFAVSPKVLNHLAVPRWWHSGTYISFSVDFPYHDMVGVLQWWNLFDRLFPTTLRRIHDAELKATGDDKFTVAEYLGRVDKACWADSTDAERAEGGDWTDASPFIPDTRRSLQREYLSVMEPLVRTPPGTILSPDIHAMVQESLRAQLAKVSAVLKSGKLDFASRAHLTACKSRIDRMLAPKLDEYKGGYMNEGMSGG